MPLLEIPDALLNGFIILVSILLSKKRTSGFFHLLFTFTFHIINDFIATPQHLLGYKLEAKLEA